MLTFTVGGKTKVKNVSLSIENEGDVICLLGSIRYWKNNNS
jgi:ABC-type cobalamin/Fe3+-siderophores transport system ATPase subunit